MAAVDIESVIKKGVEEALNEPILNGKSVLKWAEIGIRSQEHEQWHWISVKDNRPKDQKPVIVYVPPHTNRYGDEFIGYVGMAYYTYSVNGGHWCGTDGNVYGAIGAIATPSHWMPLPEPPEGVKQDG